MITYEATNPKPAEVTENIMVDGVKVGGVMTSETGYRAYVMPKCSEHVMCFAHEKTKEAAVSGAFVKASTVCDEIKVWLESVRESI